MWKYIIVDTDSNIVDIVNYPLYNFELIVKNKTIWEFDSTNIFTLNNTTTCNYGFYGDSVINIYMDDLNPVVIYHFNKTLDTLIVNNIEQYPYLNFNCYSKLKFLKIN